MFLNIFFSDWRNSIGSGHGFSLAKWEPAEAAGSDPRALLKKRTRRDKAVFSGLSGLLFLVHDGMQDDCLLVQ